MAETTWAETTQGCNDLRPRQSKAETICYRYWEKSFKPWVAAYNYGYPKFDFWLSNILHDFRISINRILDIQKSNYGYPIFNLIFDILNSIWGYPKLDFWISKNRIMDIQKSNYGYPKILPNIGYPKKSSLLLDIQKCNYGYPKIDFFSGCTNFYGIWRQGLTEGLDS